MLDPTTAPAVDPAATASPALRRRSNRLPPQLILGAILAGFVVALTVLSYFWTPWDPAYIDVANRLKGPSATHWFGTDNLGRDLLSRVMTGGQNSLYVTLSATVLGVLFGTALGLAAAGGNPRVSTALTRIADIGIAMPSILIALVLATTVGPGNLSIVIAISVWFIPVTARVVIGPARQILGLEFIEAAYTHGRAKGYILMRHVLPNIAPLIIVQVSVMIPAGILIEAALSFLGVGAQPPISSWGSIMANAQPRLELAPYFTLLPGAMIVISVLGFNLLGDGLRVVLDPQQSSRGVG
jgi:peptide/nickel transport system permease protein